MFIFCIQSFRNTFFSILTLRICFKTVDILAQSLKDALQKKTLMDPGTEEKGRRCRLAILVLYNVTLDRVFRQVIEDHGLTDEELMSLWQTR